MPRASYGWVYVGGRAGNKPGDDDKREIIAACERVIEEVLRPRYLPEIEPTRFNYPVAIHGKWHGNKYRFMTRLRSGFPDNRGEEFDAPFSRIEYVSKDLFDVSWHRHTGEWHPLFQRVTLAEALRLVAEEGILAPPI